MRLSISIFVPADMNHSDISPDRSLQNHINLALLPIAVMAGTMNLFLITFSVRLFRKAASAPYAIVCSLTIADSLQTLLASPLLIYFKALGVYYESAVHCRFASSLVWLGKPASALSLALLCLDKLVRAKREYLYVVYMSPARTLVYIGLIWGVSALNVIAINAVGLVDFVPADGPWPTPPPLGPRLTRYANLNFCEGLDQRIAMPWYIAESLLLALCPVLLAGGAAASLWLDSQAFCETGAWTTAVNAAWLALTLLPLRLFYLLKWSLELRLPWVEFSLLCLESLYAIVNPLMTFALNEVYLRRIRFHSLHIPSLNCELRVFSVY